MTLPDSSETAAGRGFGQRLGRTLLRGLKLVGLTLFVALVFAIALIATMPARAALQFVTLPAQVTTVYGSVWSGRATLDGGYALTWDSDWPALWRLRLPVDVLLSGPDTQVSGQVVATPWRIALRDVAGRAGPGLLVLFPEVRVDRCQSRAILDIPLVSRSRSAATAEGGVRIEAGSCTLPDGTAQSIPAMLVELSAEGTDLTATLEDRDSRLARVTVAGDRRLIIRVEPEGAVLVPGLPTSGPIILEYPF